MPEDKTVSTNFIRSMVEKDLDSGKYHGRVATRFPPEPNGFLHLGHAKSICLNFGLAREHDGVCHLRFDDTNPTTEDVRYAHAIQEDIRWLGFDWGEHLYFASDYFEALYDFATILILEGLAYVDSLNEQEIREYRGTVTEAGRDSPYRNRAVEENLDLFERMRAGEFANGAHVLRARIDMASPNMLMRDPLLYRIRHAHHYRRGSDWCIYPMYDFAHCLSDAIEHVTHSLCTLEFKDNRALYDWVLEAVSMPTPRPEQTEFARLNLEYTVLSKRKLIRLVEGGFVSGWDDPRMPTLAGIRRRGVRPEAIRQFCELIGVARVDSRVDMGKLDHCVRDDLNPIVPRVMCVLRPLRVVLTNFAEDEVDWIDSPLFPHDVPREGSRPVPFSRVLYIEREDFAEVPPPGFRRFAPAWEVRLRYGYVIRCDEVVKDPDTGEVVELRCTYDPNTRGGQTPDGRAVKGTIHWVAASNALPATVRLYDRLFSVPNPDETPEGSDFTDRINPASLVTLEGFVEPHVAGDAPGSRYQFERQGYFVSDIVDSSESEFVFNRIVSLRDTWARSQAGSTELAGVGSKKSRGNKAVDRASRAGEKSGDPDRKKPKRSKVKTEQDPNSMARFNRYRNELGLSRDDAELLSRSSDLANIFESALAKRSSSKLVANWVVNDVARELKARSAEDLPFSGSDIGELVSLIENGTISNRAAKDVFTEMAAGRGRPADLVSRLGLEQISDRDSILQTVSQVLSEHPNELTALKSGKDALRGFFIGQIMKATGGKANPTAVKEALDAKLEEVMQSKA